MKEKNTLNDALLGAVVGGDGPVNPPRFMVGDSVTLVVYPEYGVGTILCVYQDGSDWKCTVQFPGGEMNASEDEFDPA